MNETVATEPNVFGQRSDGGSAFGLTQLIFSLVGIFAGYRGFLWLAGFYLIRGLEASPNNSVALVTGLSYPAASVFVLLEMIVVIWTYRPVRGLFKTLQRPTEESRWTREALVGAGAGALAFLMATPFLKDLNTRVFLNTIVPSSQPIGLRSMMYVLLLGIALPTAGEMVFRGIVLRTLEGYASSFAAILASTLLFVFLWPLFGVPVVILLSVMASMLYEWRKSLVSPIVANIVMTLSGGLYVLWRIWS